MCVPDNPPPLGFSSPGIPTDSMYQANWKKTNQLSTNQGPTKDLRQARSYQPPNLNRSTIPPSFSSIPVPLPVTFSTCYRVVVSTYVLFLVPILGRPTYHHGKTSLD